MVKIYLLTAPFDEEAKTGDGQYAASLTSGFVQNYETIQCTWLKKNDGHYSIPLPAESTSVPHETIPSAEVLQPVANERTRISGYKLDTPLSSTVEVEEVNKQTVSPKTPKIIIRHDNILHSLTIMDIYSLKPIQLTREKVQEILSHLDTKREVLNTSIRNNEQKLSKLSSQKAIKNKLVKYYKKNKGGIQQYCSLNEYLEAHFQPAEFKSRYDKAHETLFALNGHFDNPINLKELEQLTDYLSGIKGYHYDFHSNNLPYDIEKDTKFRSLYDLNLLKSSIDTIILDLKSLIIRQSVAQRNPEGFSQLQDPNVAYSDKVNWVYRVYLEGYTSTHDRDQFARALLNPSSLNVDLASSADVEEAIQTYSKISGKLHSSRNILIVKNERAQLLSELQSLILNKREPYTTSNTRLNSFYGKRPFRAAEGFHLAYQANQRDPLKHYVILDIINSMQPIDDNTYLDIHIRPPDCGVFISPRDIRTFQEAGIKVNITIHEYKQNYTRRYLQQYTHDLMRQADTVQFFNEMDRDNAIIAATYGDCDKRNTTEPTGVAKKAREVGADYSLEKFPVEPYDLAGKSGLTVASQQLSTAPSHPSDVIKRAPNILSFGTIRPGKGFEEALNLARLVKADAQTIQTRINATPIVKLAGDPQDKELMQQIVEERFGAGVVAAYQHTHQYNNDFSNGQRRDYWKGLVNELNNQVTQGMADLNNPYIEIHPWCEHHELVALKESCKYVCRMDDMGMRNNGSAIISVLDVGIVYTKFGSVTDNIYTKDGQYGKAVDIGKYRYGKYSLLKREEDYRAQFGHDVALPRLLSHPDSDYKRKPESREPKEILDSIIAREVNQLNTEPELSENYQTVVEAQKLLKERFTLKNAADHLLQNVGLGHLIIREVPEDLFDEVDPVLAQTEEFSQLADITPPRLHLSRSCHNFGFFSPSCALESRVLPHKLSQSQGDEIQKDSSQDFRASQN